MGDARPCRTLTLMEAFMPHTNLKTLPAALGDLRLILSTLAASGTQMLAKLRRRLRHPVPTRRSQRKRQAARLRPQPKPANTQAAPPIARIDYAIIAELRAMTRDEPHFADLARRIVTRPEVAVTQTTADRRMAWLLLRELHRMAAFRGTAA